MYRQYIFLFINLLENVLSYGVTDIYYRQQLRAVVIENKYIKAVELAKKTVHEN